MNALKTAFLLGTLTALLVGVGAVVGGKAGAVGAFVVALAMNGVSYWFSDKIVLSKYGAQEVTPMDAPRMHAVVDRLAASMDIPKPRVYVIPERSPNAFATGRSPSHAAIAATEGLLELMSDDELEGVLGHELGHVLNRDILTSTVAATLAGAIMLMAQFARFLPFMSSGSSRERGGGVNPIAMLVAVILAPFAAMLIQLFISRTREYAADETGARATGRPDSLANALEKLGQVSGRIPMDASPSTSHLFIVRPRVSLGGLQSLFSTHPPIEQRVARLRAMGRA